MFSAGTRRESAHNPLDSASNEASFPTSVATGIHSDVSSAKRKRETRALSVPFSLGDVFTHQLGIAFVTALLAVGVFLFLNPPLTQRRTGSSAVTGKQSPTALLLLWMVVFGIVWSGPKLLRRK